MLQRLHSWRPAISFSNQRCQPLRACTRGIYMYFMMYTTQGIRSGVGGGGGGTVFPRELNPVNWFCTARELGPGDRIP